MELTFDFEVGVPVEQAWAVLTDVERIAPCLPGAELQEVEGDEYRGVVKVKVGPITASYKGAAHFLEQDPVAHRGVLKAEGRETRGQGNASATITASLAELGGDRTKVQIVTDLAITGKVAQFGRGMLAEISGKLLEQFVHNLETMVLAPPSAPVSASGEASTSAEPASAKVATAPASEKGEAAHADPAKPAAKAAKSTRSRAAAKPAASATSTVAGEGEPTEAVSAAGTTAGGEPASSAEPSESQPAPQQPATIRQIQSAPVEPVDLGRIAGPSLARRLVPFASIAGVLFLARVVVYALRRRKQ